MNVIYLVHCSIIILVTRKICDYTLNFCKNLVSNLMMIWSIWTLQVGDGNTDHYCWQRPEDTTTSRQAYRIDPNHPGSDLAGETAAAMASASIVFRRSNPAYSNELLNHAKQVWAQFELKLVWIKMFVFKFAICMDDSV